MYLPLSFVVRASIVEVIVGMSKLIRVITAPVVIVIPSAFESRWTRIKIGSKLTKIGWSLVQTVPKYNHFPDRYSC